MYDVISVNSGFLITDLNISTVKAIQHYDDTHEDHPWGWTEYQYYNCDIYPRFLNQFADLGFAFGWEYVLTEDFSYYAYNFPTPNNPNNLVQFRTGKRKQLPRLTKKFKEELEDLSATNELLYTLGKSNGSN